MQQATAEMSDLKRTAETAQPKMKQPKEGEFESRIRQQPLQGEISERGTEHRAFPEEKPRKTIVVEDKTLEGTHASGQQQMAQEKQPEYPASFLNQVPAPMDRSEEKEMRKKMKKERKVQRKQQEKERSIMRGALGQKHRLQLKQNRLETKKVRAQMKLIEANHKITKREEERNKVQEKLIKNQDKLEKAQQKASRKELKLNRIQRRLQNVKEAVVKKQEVKMKRHDLETKLLKVENKLSKAQAKVIKREKKLEKAHLKAKKWEEKLSHINEKEKELENLIAQEERKIGGKEEPTVMEKREKPLMREERPETVVQVEPMQGTVPQGEGQTMSGRRGKSEDLIRGLETQGRAPQQPEETGVSTPSEGFGFERRENAPSEQGFTEARMSEPKVLKIPIEESL